MLRKDLLVHGVLLSCIILVSSCGGGGGDGGDTPNGVIVGGSVVRSHNTSGTLSLATTSGNSEGTIMLNDSDGNSLGSFNDQDKTLTEDFTSDYEYIDAYRISYMFDGARYDLTGIQGRVTPSADITKNDVTATYTGAAQGFILTESLSLDLTDGTSTVIVNFGLETADVTMDRFTVTDQVSGLSTIGPIDTISVTGMTISGNSFRGGVQTVTTTNLGSSVDVTGTGTEGGAIGHFFGYNDELNLPEELGGTVFIQGEDGIVYGVFIAD